MKKIITLMAMLAIVAGVATAAPKKDKAEKKIATAVFVTDLDCDHCAQKIYNTIPFERGIKDVKADVATKSVTVKFDAAKNDVQGIVKAFTSIKVKVFKWECDGKKGEIHHHDHAGHNHAGHNHAH